MKKPWLSGSALYAGGGPWMAEFHPPSAAHPLSGVGLPQTCPRRTAALPQPGSSHCNPLLAVSVCLEVELSPVWQCCGCYASLCTRVMHFACSMMGCNDLQILFCRQHRSAQDRKRPGGKKAAKGKSAGVGWSPMKARAPRRPPPLVLPEIAADATDSGDLHLLAPICSTRPF
jgi:hypothetical protein